MTPDAPPSSAEVLAEWYRKHGPIHGADYDQARAFAWSGRDPHAEAIDRAIPNAGLRDGSKDEPATANAIAGDLGRNAFAELRQPLVAIELAEFLAKPIPPRAAMLSPVIMEQSLTMLHAWRGVGKTYVALEIGYVVASGGGFLRWKAERPRKVLYLDGEMPAGAMQERLARIVASAEKEAPPGFFKLVTPDLQTGAMPDLATAEGQARVDALLDTDTALIVIDNLSSLVRSGTENEAESWLPVATWALRHRTQGRSILFVHHSGKSGAQRGTSKREDLLDTVLYLKQPPDYNPSDGARFEVRFEKARGLLGEDTAPFEARLAVDSSGRQAWTLRMLEESRRERILALKAEGLSLSEIASELGVNKSTVSRALKKATEDGDRTLRGDAGAAVARCIS
jgi:DNA-binding transcriptional ArsR family regulator